MYKALFVLAAAVASVFAQTVDVEFFEDETCSESGVGCAGLRLETCCDPVGLFTSIGTDNWQNVAAGTEVHADSSQGDDVCAIVVAALEEGECLISETPDVFTGADFENGVARRKRTLGVKADGERCTSTQPADQYFYKPGDGFKYIVSAQNETHAAAWSSAATSQERSQYIMANFEKKVPVAPYNKFTKFSG